jgi:hypothetical protein
MTRHGRITDPRHICGPSLDPPDDGPDPCECDGANCNQEGWIVCVCQTAEDDGTPCAICDGEGRIPCECACHQAWDDPDGYDEDARWER